MPKKQQRKERTAKPLSRREREMMDIIFRVGAATVTEVRSGMGDPPSYSAVRSTLNILETKGHLTHRHDGNRYVYLPTVDREAAQRSALDHVLTTFFDGSAADAVTALLSESADALSGEDLERLSKMIKEARREGR